MICSFELKTVHFCFPLVLWAVRSGFEKAGSISKRRQAIASDDELVAGGLMYSFLWLYALGICRSSRTFA